MRPFTDKMLLVLSQFHPTRRYLPCGLAYRWGDYRTFRALRRRCSIEFVYVRRRGPDEWPNSQAMEFGFYLTDEGVQQLQEIGRWPK